MKRTADVNSSFICFASAEEKYKVVGFSDLNGLLEPDLFYEFFSPPLIHDKDVHRIQNKYREKEPSDRGI